MPLESKRTLALVLLAGATSAAAGVPGEKPMSVEGCELSVTLTPDKAELSLGEPLFLTFRVITGCEKHLGVIDGGDYRNSTGRAETYVLHATSSDGQKVPTFDGGPQFGGLSSSRPLTRGTPFEKRLLVDHWLTFPSAGSYRLTVDKTLFVGTTGSAHEVDNTQVPVSVSTRVTITPPSRATLGKIIDTLGAHLGASDAQGDEAAIALRAIRDERVVPYFAKLMTSPNPTNQMNGIWGLTPYGSDEAFNALKAALKIDSVRLAAAQVLATNPNPKAWPTLWALRDDADENVRLTVLHALAKRTGPTVEADLKPFMSDRSAMVKGEAERYLRERAHDHSERSRSD